MGNSSRPLSGLTELHSDGEACEAVLKYSLAPFWIVEKGRIVLINDASVRLLKGLSADQFLGRSASEFLCLQPGNDTSGEFVRLDGSAVCVRVSNTQIAFRGSVASYMEFSEIDSQRNLEIERERSNAELFFRATLLEEVLEPAFAWVLGGPITYWNRAAEELYGYTRKEAIGRGSHELLKTTAAITMEEMEAALAGAGRWEGELRHVTRSGQHLTVESRLRRVDLPAGRFVIECTRDVTNKREAESKLREFAANLEERVRERTRELSEANDDLEAYAYSISHDLRAPLRAMQGFSDALIEDYSGVLDDTARQYAARIRAAAKRMDQLIEDLLEYSRISRARSTRTSIDLNAVVADVLSQQQDALERSGAHLQISPEMPRVCGNYGVLTQVMGNLIANAIKFVAPGHAPAIEIGANTRGGCIRFWVKDHGIGIEPEHQARIFRVFERLHGVETYPGTGVGLAIVKKGVERLGGCVGVESQAGAGSCFWIELPSGQSRMLH